MGVAVMMRRVFPGLFFAARGRGAGVGGGVGGGGGGGWGKGGGREGVGGGGAGAAFYVRCGGGPAGRATPRRRGAKLRAGPAATRAEGGEGVGRGRGDGGEALFPGSCLAAAGRRRLGEVGGEGGEGIGV